MRPTEVAALCLDRPFCSAPSALHFLRQTQPKLAQPDNPVSPPSPVPTFFSSVPPLDRQSPGAAHESAVGNCRVAGYAAALAARLCGALTGGTVQGDGQAMMGLACRPSACWLGLLCCASSSAIYSTRG